MPITQKGEWLVYSGLVCLFLVAVWAVAYFVHSSFSAKRGIRGSAPYVLLSVFLSWFLPFMVVFMLPIDVGSAIYRKCQQDCVEPLVYLSESTMQTVWQSMYWTIFVVTWIAIPILQSWVDGGGFTALQRLKEVLRYRLMYLAVIIVLAFIFIAYVVATKTPMDLSAVKGFLMALSNAYGLVLLLLFLGYGLVDIPRTLWHSANVRRRLRILEMSAPRIKEDYDASIPALQKILAEIVSLSAKVPQDDPLRPYMDSLVDKCSVQPLVPQNRRIIYGDLLDRRQSINRAVSLSNLEKLNEAIKKAKLAKDRLEYKWGCTCKEAQFLQRILDNQGNTDRRFHYGIQSRHVFREKVEWLWYIVVRSVFLRTCALLLGLFSLLFVWSEITMNAGLSAYELIPAKNYSAMQFFCLLTILYLSCCCFVPLLSLRIFSFYQLAPHHTSVSSLLFFAGYLTRLSFPLCWNVLLVSGVENSIFSQIMYSVNLVPLGLEFNNWMPISLAVLCLLTLFHVHSRIMKVFNIDTTSYLDKSDNLDEYEGRSLLMGSPPSPASIPIPSAYTSVEKQQRLFVPLSRLV